MDGRERRLLESVLGQLAESPGNLNRLATDLPVDRPPPRVLFPGRTFVFAGEMAYGPRRACEREVEELGGSCDRAVTRRTDYLVIGSLDAEGSFAHGPMFAPSGPQTPIGGRGVVVVPKRRCMTTTSSQAAFGPYVDDVVQLRDRGAKVAVISEARWAAALP